MLCISQLTLVFSTSIYPLNLAHVFFFLVCFYKIMDYSKSRVCILCLELSVITTVKPSLFGPQLSRLLDYPDFFLWPNSS